MNKEISLTLQDFNPSKSDDWDEILDKQIITELEFMYITLAYFTTTDTYSQVIFAGIKVDTIRKALEISPGKYKDYTSHYVRLGDPNPIDNSDITFEVINRNNPIPSPTLAKTHYSVALFISILEFYRINDNDDIEFSWGKRINKATGQIHTTIIFRFNTNSGTKFFDYSSEEPTYNTFNPGIPFM